MGGARFFYWRSALREMNNMKNDIIEFAKFSNDERLEQIMKKGDSTDLRNFELLAYSIQNDPDLSVRFAALKRIHKFKEHSGLIPLLKDLQVNPKSQQLEPCFSMALSRVGLITMEEFEKRIS